MRPGPGTRAASDTSNDAASALLRERALPSTGALIAGRYEVVEETERPGGFAGYKVRHDLLGSLLIVTAVPDELAADVERLARVREAARLAGALRHDHIVPVLDLVEDAGRYFIVEPSVDGTSLDRLIATGALDPAEALYVARQLADALAYAHEAGVVHGTVSPANVVVEDGSPPRARLAGFALAALAGTRSPIPTRFLRYTAPECLAREADACADVFGLGQVVYELFEGRPFLTGSRGQVEALLRDGTAPFVPRFSKVVPAGLSGLVARMIRRTPAERQQQMNHVRADLDACLRSLGQRAPDVPDAPVVPPRPLAPPPPPPPAATPAPVPPPVAPEPRPPVVAEEPVPTDETDAVPPPVVPPAAGPHPPGSAERPPVVRSLHAVKRPRPATTPRPDATARFRWRTTPRPEATFPSRILVRASEPRTPVRGKLLVVGVLVALGWVALPFAPRATTSSTGAPAPATPAPVAVVPEPVAVATTLPAVVATALPLTEAEAPKPGAPPRIEAQEPAGERITLPAGESTTFHVWAAGGGDDDPLTYAWALDGKPVGEGPEWQMTATAASQAMTYLVQVKVADRAGPPITTSWTVAVPPSHGAPAPKTEQKSASRSSKSSSRPKRR